MLDMLLIESAGLVYFTLDDLNLELCWMEPRGVK